MPNRAKCRAAVYRKGMYTPAQCDNNAKVIVTTEEDKRFVLCRTHFNKAANSYGGNFSVLVHKPFPEFSTTETHTLKGRRKNEQGRNDTEAE